MEASLRLLTATILAGLVGFSPAYAQDCASPYTVDNLLGDLTGVESGLRSADEASAASAGARLRDGLGCLNEILPAMIAARAYRAVGTGLHVGGDTEGAKKWFRTSLELDPTWIYGINDLAVDHPARLAFDALKTEDSPEAMVLAGKDFPEESKNYLDGRKLSSPKARPDRFHVFQRDDDGTKTWLIEGNAFPGDAVVEAEAPDPIKEPKKKDKKDKQRAPKDKAPKDGKQAKQPKAKKAKPPKTKIGPNGEVIYKRRRPAEKTPLMIAGGVVLASAGAIYYAAYQQKRKFDAINTAADVNPGLELNEPFDLCGLNEDPSTGCVKDPSAAAKRIAGNANRLSLAALGVAAVGVAGLTWGIIVDGDSVTPTVNFRW